MAAAAILNENPICTENGRYRKNKCSCKGHYHKNALLQGLQSQRAAITKGFFTGSANCPWYATTSTSLTTGCGSPIRRAAIPKFTQRSALCNRKHDHHYHTYLLQYMPYMPNIKNLSITTISKLPNTVCKIFSVLLECCSLWYVLYVWHAWYA